MAWIEGKLETTVTIDVSHEEVLAFVKDPNKFRDAFGQMESGEELEEGVWKWTLKEKAEKGIKFQGIYKVKYTTTDNGTSWETLEGNVNSTGSTLIKDLGNGKTELEYKETLKTDLPIPRLMAKVFQPIVGREVTKGITEFLNNATEILEK